MALKPHPEKVVRLGVDWFNLVTRSPLTARVTSSHLVPRETFVHYVDPEGTCVCGPWMVEMNPSFYRHWPLEGWEDPDVVDAL